jgi:tetratricopeptide (TPR) repeat protein
VFRPRLGEERMIYSEMVGRGKELNKLELQVMKAINGEGSVVNIIGEAGIGKSRLVAELKNHDVMKQVTMLEGSAISIGKNLSFHPIIDLIKQWAKIKTKDSDTDAFKKLELAVQSVDFENSNEIIPFVATLMGMKLSPNYAERIVGIEGKALEKLLFKNVRDLLIKATKSTPIVIIIEDLHWSDRSSIDLLSSLYRLAENYSILFINVFRPGYSETSDQIVKVLKDELSVYYVEISIEPLDGQLSEALIINMLKISGLPYNVMENIVSRSDGNPFFIEEVVRSLIDTGAVILKDGGYEVTEQINHVSIPHSINEVLMARIDHLDESNRNLVKIASVIGRNFFYRVLDKVAEDIEDVDGILSYLKAIQLIRERERLDEIQYIFKHALAQEAAYKSILETRRTALHLKIAASIEKIFRDRLYEFYGILSYHYIRGDDHDKAEEFLLKAGEEAIRSSASSEAIYYYKEALKLYLNKHGEHADNKTIIKMEKNIALALYNKGLNAEALEYFDRVLLKYGVKFPKHSITSIAKAFVDFISYLLSLYIPFLKWHKTANRQDNEIIDILVKKLTVLSISDMTAFLKYQFSLTRRLSKYKIDTVENGVEILAGSSLMFSWSGISFGLSRKVLAFVKKKVNIHETNNSPILQFTTLMYNTLTGENLQKEEPYNTQLIEDGLRSGELFYTTFYINLNMLHSIDRGQYVNASTQKERLLEIYDAYGFETARILYFYGSAKLLMKYRKFRKASYDIKVGFEFLTKIDSKFHLIGLLSCQARIHIMRGDHKSARSTLKQAKKIMPRLIPAFYFTEYLLSRFCYETSKIENSVKADKNASTQKNIKKAFSAGKMAINNSRKIAVNRVEIFRVMGRLYWLVNRQNKAMDFWNKSVEHGKYMGHKLELSRTYFEIGSRLLAKSSNYNDFNGISAEEYLDKARTMFDEMNLKWDLEQLKRLQTYS